MNTATEFLDYLNSTYFTLHKEYEDLFWVSYMGDHSNDKKMNAAQTARDAFRANLELAQKVEGFLKEDKSTAKMKSKAGGKTSSLLKARFEAWQNFFSKYQTPPEALEIKARIQAIESDIHQKRNSRTEGYLDPKPGKNFGKFVEMSESQMTFVIMTSEDEALRKACYDAREKMATGTIDEYLQLVELRNRYAKLLGHSDFYEYKAQTEDGMSKRELFAIFDAIYEKTEFAYKNIRQLEKGSVNANGQKSAPMLGLRKPWNFSYMMAGDFTKEQDPYFQFDDALLRWGKSFQMMGIDLAGGKLQLDLMERKGKEANGFCHWPDVVIYEKGAKNGKNSGKYIRRPGSSNFTCNVTVGQVGSGVDGYETLFHEGGHAAHFLNCDQRDVCMNTEYAPMSAAWAETHSMFLDAVFSSVEWRTAYAQDAAGNFFPYELYEKEITKMHPTMPLEIKGILFVANFERKIYEAKSLTKEKVLQIARSEYRKFYDMTEDSLLALNVPHIYAWESSCSYHGYGLATLALHQWREYFYKKYGHIVDNANVGKEMSVAWRLGSSKTFSEFVRIITGKKLSADPYLRVVTAPLEKMKKNAKDRIANLAKVRASAATKKRLAAPIDLKADIAMVHGKQVIANCTNGKNGEFEKMAGRYAIWIKGIKD